MKYLRLELDNPGGDEPFVFAAHGSFTPRWEPVHNEISNPPAVVGVRLVWEFRGLQLRSPDGTTASLWTDVLALRTLIESRAEHPQWARLVRDPGTDDETTILTLGADGGYEGFRVESLTGGDDPRNPAASWRTTATFTLVVSVDRRNEIASGVTAGIVGLQQEVSETFVAGLRTLRWTTTITTKEGVSAVDKAKALAVIPIGDLGGNYSYATNGPDGIEWVALDANEAESRIPTRVRAISEVREWGIPVGVTAPGVSPDSFSYSETDEVRIEQSAAGGGFSRVVRERVISAGAEGPGAYDWVLAQAPPSSAERSIENDAANNRARATWTVKDHDLDPTSGPAGVRTQLDMTISGGARIQSWRLMGNGYPPALRLGAFTPVELRVAVTVSRVGGTGALHELPLPGLLEQSAGWWLDESESTEGAPEIVEPGASATQHRWQRVASLVYRRATRPQDHDPFEVLRTQPPVPSYYLASVGAGGGLTAGGADLPGSTFPGGF